MDDNADMKRFTIILVMALILAVGASFAIGHISARRMYERLAERPDTVTVTRWVRDTVYEPKDSFIVKYKPVYLAVHDTTEVHDTTTIRDSVLVDVPITEKTYYGDNYRATVRGFQPELTDIWVKQTERIITMPYRKRWGVTAGPQVGYGFTPQGWQPYAGVGVTFGYSF